MAVCKMTPPPRRVIKKPNKQPWDPKQQALKWQIYPAATTILNLLVKDSMFRIITDDAPESRTSLRLFRIIKIPYILFTRYTFSIEHIFHPPPTTFGYRETQAYAVAPLPRNVEFGRVRRMVLLLLGVRMVRRLVFSVRAVQQHTLSGCIIHLSLCNIPKFPWFCGESSSRTSREVSLHRAFFCLLF